MEKNLSDKENVIHTPPKRTYSGTLFSLKKEILPFATIWMNLEDVMLSEISQTQKEKGCVISLVCGI